MNDDEKEIENIKAMIRAVLQSSKEGVQNFRLQRDYCEFAGDFIPFKKLGYGHLEDFIRSIPDVVTIKRNSAGEIMYRAVADESTVHIQRLVSKQKSKKTKNRRSLTFPSRKPLLHTPRWTPQQYPSPPVPQRRPPYRAPQPSPHYYGPAYHSRFEVYEPPHRRPLEMTDGYSNFKVVVDSRQSSQRSVHVGGEKTSYHPRIEDTRKREAFDLPPRFRRMYQDSPKPTPTSTRHRQKEETMQFTEMTDEKKYADHLSSYSREKNLNMVFKTMPARVGKSTGFVSTVELQGVSYGSGDVFNTKVAAEAAACKTACQELGLTPASENQKDTDVSVPEALIRERIKEILISKPNGLWSTRLPVEYKEKFQEDPPDNLIFLIKKWKDLAKVEKVANTDREIVYPVVEDPNKAKELIIPKGDVLPQGEKVTVYITFIYSCGYFCVQKKDSVIDDIVAELESSCKSQPVPDADVIDKGCYCAALYSSDGSWSRGEVIECYPSEKAFDVLYVDYGNMEKVSISGIRWLSEKAAAFPSEVVYCSLFGLIPLDGSTEQAEGKWSDESMKAFAEMVSEKELFALVQAYDENVCEVELFDAELSDVSINQKLIDQGFVKDLYAVEVERVSGVSEEDTRLSDEPPLLLLPTDDIWGVYVGFVNSSLNHVFVRLVGEEYSEKLEKFEAKLEETFKDAPDEVEFVLGSVYIAYVDGNYHRVQLLAMDDTKWRCHFLDHGDCDELIPEQLKPLPQDLNKSLPYQAIEVSLYGLDEIAQDTTALEKLFDTALGLTCVAEVVSRDPISVILYDTEGNDDIDLNAMISKTVEKKNKQEDKTSESGKKTTVDLNELIKELNEEAASSVQACVGSVSSPESNFNSVIENNNEKERTTSSLPNHTVAGDDKLSEESMSVIDSARLESIVGDGAIVTPCTETKNIYSWDKSRTDGVVSPGSSSITSDTIDMMNELKVDSQPDESVELTSDEDLWDIKKYRSRSLPPDLTFPSSGEFMDVHVIDVTDPFNFQCVPYEYMEELDSSVTALNNQLTQKKPERTLTFDEVVENQLYAGLQDDVWCRVLVNNKVARDLVSVRMVDFGVFTVMSIDELQPLPSSFWQLPFLSFKCKLAGISMCDGEVEWSEGAKFKFLELVLDKSLVALCCGKDKNGQLSLKLVDTSVEDVDVCIAEVLVDLKLAKMTEKI